MIEHQTTTSDRNTFLAHLLGRVVPHSMIVWYLMYFLSDYVSTLHRNLWLFIVGYGLFTLFHTYCAFRRLRFLVTAAGTLLLSFVIFGAAQLLTVHTEVGSYYASVLSFFLLIVLWFSAVNNYWFLLSSFYYIIELVILNALWIALVISRSELKVESLVALSFPILAYSIYVLLFD
jgi:hypothetical protein